MIKKIVLITCLVPVSLCAVVTIKNDTHVTHFLTCDKIGYLVEPQKDVQIEVEEVSWLKSWWKDPSIITLYKKIGDTQEFQATFEVKPNNTKDESPVIFISDVQRKARHVSAPFSVKNVNANEPDSAEQS